MENNSLQPDIPELPSAAMHPRADFPSEEAMKTYYLQLADLMNVRYAEEPSEYLTLKCLHRKLRQFTCALQLIGQHEWGQGISEIQNACGVYMLQNVIERKILLQNNREIGKHLQFITQLAGNVGFLKQLEGILYYHFQNVKRILETMKAENAFI